MRALHVVPAVARRYGGPSEAALRMVAAVSEAGWDTLLATTDADGPGRLAVEAGVPIEYEGVPVIFFPSLRGDSLKLSPALSRWLVRNAGRYDLVHVHSVFSHPSLAAGAAAKAADVPYVVRPLGQLDAWSLSHHAIRKRAFLAAGGRRLLERADAVHWTDESERNSVPPFGWTTNGFVTPLGVEEELFEIPEDRERARTVLFLSRLHPKKNVEALLCAFLSEKVAPKDWRLVIAGDGDDRYVASLKGLVSELDGEDRVLFVGWLSGEAKRRALRDSALVVLPSFQENFGIVVAEAMAAGTPVVVSEAVALAGAVKGTRAGWVAPTDRHGLGKVLGEALSSTEERRRRGGAARAHARERYRWSAIGGQLVREYEAIIGSRRART